MSNFKSELIPEVVAVQPLQTLASIAAQAADFIIGWRNQQPVTRGDFMDAVQQWHATLQPLVGKNFALYLEDSLDFGAALFAAWHAGKTIWLSADTLDASMLALQKNVDGFIGEFPPRYQPVQRSAQVAAMHNAAIHLSIVLDPDWTGLVVHTSGTTGAAQAIPKKLSQLASEVAMLEHQFGARIASAEIVATVSHQHIYGLLFKVLWPLASHRQVHALSQPFPEQLAHLLTTRYCALIASPAHLKRLPAHLQWNQKNVAAVFSSGGALVVEVAYATTCLLGQAPIEILGSSETGGIAWRQRTDGSDAAWQALPNVAWRVSEDGLLEVSSAHLPDSQWWTTSDCVAAVEQQRFVLQGRRDRIVKIEEKRVSLATVEQTLLASPLVQDVRTIVVDQSPGKEIEHELEPAQTQFLRHYLVAVIVLSPAGNTLLQQLGKFEFNKQLKRCLQSAVEPIALPRKWRYVAQLPIDSQGKTTQALLLALVAAAPELDAEFEVEQKSAAATELLSAVQLKVLSQDPLNLELELTWPGSSLCFAGHFADFPVLPGVMQVNNAIAIGRQFFALPAHFHAMHALKFQHVILPNQTVILRLQFVPAKRSLHFSYASAHQHHSSGRLLFND